MILTKFQKKIIDKIISGEITDISSFIKWKYEDKKISIINYLDTILDSDNKKYKLSFSFKKYDNENIDFYSGDLPKKYDIYFVEDFQPIGEFISLWNKLEKEGYIIATKSILNHSQLVCYMKRKEVIDMSSSLNISTRIGELKEVFESFNNYVEKQFPNLSPEDKEKKSSELLYKVMEQNQKELTYEEANEMLNEKGIDKKYRDDYFFLKANSELIRYVGVYIDKVIIPLIDLKEFKENNYQSISNLRVKSEKRERIIAQTLTILISILSISLSIYTTFNKSNSEESLNQNLKKLYQSQEKLNNFYLKYDKVLNQLIK